MKTFILLIAILIAHESFGHDHQQKSITIGQQDQQKSITFGQEVQQEKIDKRAESTFQNCNCQCDSYTWTDGTTIKGNCKSQDNNGALFCYVSGRARTACGDVQTSSTVRDNLGNPRYYSYEACTTPPRPQCNNNQRFPGSQNFGEGDISVLNQQGQGGQGGLIGLLGGQSGGPFRGQGINGPNGVHGGNGVYGVNGVNGVNGGNGINEVNGINGGNGVNGVYGVNGGHGRPTERPVYININVKSSGGSSDSGEYTGPNDVGA